MESLVMRAPPAKTIVLRVRAARPSSRVAKLWRGSPLSALRRDTLVRAAWERRGGADGVGA